MTERVIDTIATFGPDREQVVPEATLDQLGVDSLHMVELAQIAEDDYGVQLKGAEVDEITTVGEAIELIWSRMQS